MKVLVTGATGQLGYDIIKELKKRSIDVVGIGSKDCDITVKNAVFKTIEDIRPNAIIHCAGYTAVDNAEIEIDKCNLINVEGTKNIALACKKYGITLLYVSTDYVFSGHGTEPWKPDDERKPVSQYGKSKYQGELAVESLLDKYFIVRISWVFGINGKNFVKTMLKLAETNNEITVVSDQVGSPTYTVDAAKVMVDMIQTDKYGRYNVSNEESCSWDEFAQEIFAYTDKKIKIIPVSSEEYGAKAIRPSNSRMDKSKLVQNEFKILPCWKDALKRFLKEYLFKIEEI
ncbi:dTDP-4-dehydrorhamnose reductase [Clostridium acidisoli DSM 12555]|uniref:dTDP-4-dehydrorhamnose reductase n=1 Tax=Clostridium acidisoli DSM 12555 TaxID=1121291 RepID=A0A1W1WXV9_9CLOT|nr:dTDP-4-dehydrorhamnose reductase [Clostridium acidisoli]SMC16552.1 dTDP-4-dehydrorhamnose reductase [Clostridium acidisoli DSM 12555]